MSRRARLRGGFVVVAVFVGVVLMGSPIVAKLSDVYSPGRASQYDHPSEGCERRVGLSRRSSHYRSILRRFRPTPPDTAPATRPRRRDCERLRPWLAGDEQRATRPRSRRDTSLAPTYVSLSRTPGSEGARRVARLEPSAGPSPASPARRLSFVVRLATDAGGDPDCRRRPPPRGRRPRRIAHLRETFEPIGPAPDQRRC